MVAYMPDAYLLHGLYVQEQHQLGIRMVPIYGAVTDLRKVIVRNMFAGFIWEDGLTGDWMGGLEDSVGQSTLSGVRFNPTLLSFVKRYEGRTDDIAYEFEPKAGGLWVGRFHGELVGEGAANCIVTPAPQGMLDLRSTDIPGEPPF